MNVLNVFSSNDVERGKLREKSAQIIVSLTMSVTMGTDSRATISIFLPFTSASFSADFIPTFRRSFNSISS